MALFSMSVNLRDAMDSLAQPVLLLAGGALACNYLEKKERGGLAIVLKLAVLSIFIFLWLIPMLDRISWMFTGAMAVR